MILITGATGMVGRALVSRFLAQGVPLRLQVRSSKALSLLFPELAKQRHVEVVELDFASASAEHLENLCRSCVAVVHTAGLVHQPQATDDLYDLLNLRATEALACAAKKQEIRQFVFLSTIAVYGSRLLNGTSEEASLAPDTPYGISKVKCEEYLQQNDIAPCITILRPALIFGEGDRGNMLSLMRQILRRRYFHIGQGDALKSLIYAPDLAYGIEKILQKNSAGYHVFNIANPLPVSMRSLAEAIAQAGGVGTGMLTLPELPVRVAAGMASLLLGARSPLSADRVDKLTRSTFVSIRKLEEFCSFYPEFSLAQGLQAEIAWARAEGHLAR